MERRKFIINSILVSPVIAMPKFLYSSPNSNLPNVLILGDSISIGYTPFVQEKLKGRANVYRPTFKNGKPENCQGTTKGVENIERWLSETGPADIYWDIIHFNFGLHDIKHVNAISGKNSSNPKDPQQADLKQYKNNLKTIVAKLKTTNANLIFATTTPYPDVVEGPVRKPGMPEKYNKAAIKIMNKNGIVINDLYAYMLPRMKTLQLPKNVHFKPEGYKALAGKVSERIQEVIRDF